MRLNRDNGIPLYVQVRERLLDLVNGTRSPRRREPDHHSESG